MIYGDRDTAVQLLCKFMLDVLNEIEIELNQENKDKWLFKRWINFLELNE
jgi:hypothetical protein